MKKDFDRLVKRAVRAERLETGEYDHIMDEAANTCDSDEEWDRFVAALNKGVKAPLTEREQKMLDNRKRREEIERARVAAVNAQAYYNSLVSQKS